MKILLNHLTNVLKKIIALHFIFATSGIKKMLKNVLCNIFRFFQESKKHTDDVEGSKTPKNPSCITYGTLGVEGIWAKCLAVHILVDICYDI